MCQSLQTKEGQAWIPEFLKDTTGTTVQVKETPRGVDVPLLPTDADELRIQERRDRIRKQQAKDHAGSHKPTPIRNRKDIMDEIT